MPIHGERHLDYRDDLEVVRFHCNSWSWSPVARRQTRASEGALVALLPPSLPSFSRRLTVRRDSAAVGADRHRQLVRDP
jgi:hypothetical protein